MPLARLTISEGTDMSFDEVASIVKSSASGMVSRDPFLSWGVIFVTVLIGWYVFQQQAMNDKLIEIQVEAALSGRDKITAINNLVKANTELSRVATKTADNIENLVRAVQNHSQSDTNHTQQVINYLEKSLAAAQNVEAVIKQLREQVLLGAGIKSIPTMR